MARRALFRPGDWLLAIGLTAAGSAHTWAQSCPDDNRIAIYSQLLSETNNRLVILGDQKRQSDLRLEELQSELAKRKAEDEAAAKTARKQ